MTRIIHSSSSYLQFTAYCLLWLSPVVSYHFRSCNHDNECMLDARCYRYHCARCECDEGYSVTNYIAHDAAIIEICFKPKETPLGAPCQHEFDCPVTSVCHEGVCACPHNMLPDGKTTACRYAQFGERCGHVHCDSNLGLECGGHPPLCTCAMGFHHPPLWDDYVTKLANITRMGFVMDCVQRMVGDVCSEDEHCVAVGGSGAHCHCGVCACAQQGHVPDIFGATCNKPLSIGTACKLHRADGVCDGTKGIQCGHTCDFYRRHRPETFHCACSVMHDDIDGLCEPKQVGSPCSAHLDCYLLLGGVGVCHERRCTLAEDANINHTPRSLQRVDCDILPESTSSSHLLSSKDPSQTHITSFEPNTTSATFSVATNNSAVTESLFNEDNLTSITMSEDSFSNTSTNLNDKFEYETYIKIEEDYKQFSNSVSGIYDVVNIMLLVLSLKTTFFQVVIT